jgi:UDP-glucose 4-epimerase
LNVLVTGGAGYIGSVLTEELLNEGHRVIIADNLQQGHRAAILPEVEFVPTDICDKTAVEEVFRRYPIESVMHLAAESLIGTSMTDPQKFFHTNLQGGQIVLDAMLKYQVNQIIFSSSAAVYGSPQIIPINELHPKIPINAYGESKLMFENILKWYSSAYGLKFITLRYFNAAGASLRCGEDHHPETHLIPNILRAAMNPGGSLSIFGLNYDTADGSCVRDYVHVVDIARAHVNALKLIERLSGKAFNLGSEKGYSVLEIVRLTREVTGLDIPTSILPGRPGDPDVLIADSSLARRELQWVPQYPQLSTIIESSWHWLQQHPHGYAQATGKKSTP